MKRRANTPPEGAARARAILKNNGFDFKRRGYYYDHTLCDAVKEETTYTVVEWYDPYTRELAKIMFWAGVPARRDMALRDAVLSLRADSPYFWRNLEDNARLM